MPVSHGHMYVSNHLAINNLDEWVKPEHKTTDLANKMKTCCTVFEPLGVSLIIGAWNYPVSILIQPLVGAIAAGMCM